MTDILNGILGLLTGNLSQITDNLLAVGLAVFALVLGFFAIGYLHRRRQMLHQERMASLIKGLHYAGVAQEVFAKPKRDARDHTLSGLRWLFGGLGIASAMYGYEAIQPSPDAAEAVRGALAGLVPAALGLAQLLFGWTSSRREARNRISAASPGGGWLRRLVARRAAQQQRQQALRAVLQRSTTYRPVVRRSGVPYSV